MFIKKNMQAFDNYNLDFVHECFDDALGSFSLSKNCVVGVCIAPLTPMVGTTRVFTLHPCWQGVSISGLYFSCFPWIEFFI